jgi:Rrf2 family nitric oxide-sensitive transcriptional repressor
VSEIAESFKISRNHLVKVALKLTNLGIIESIRGKSGGIRLALPPDQINIGEVIESCEPLEIVECFNPRTNTCYIINCCSLKFLLEKATDKFMGELKSCTLADLIATNQRKTKRVLKLKDA